MSELNSIHLHKTYIYKCSCLYKTPIKLYRFLTAWWVVSRPEWGRALLLQAATTNFDIFFSCLK